MINQLECEMPKSLFRIKPATITINGCEVVAQHLDGGVYVIDIRATSTVIKPIFFDTEADRDAAYAALIKPFGDAHENRS